MRTAVLLVATLAVACKSKSEPQMRSAPGSGSGSATGAVQPARRDGLPRPDFNRWAVRLNLPIYWVLDKNADKAIDEDEVTSLMFYPTASIALDTAYAQILAASKAPAPTDRRLQLLGEDLDAGRATLVWNDLSAAPPEQKEFVGHMLAVGKQVDELYAIMNGSAALASQVPADPTSQSAFRRNRGPKCIGPNTEKDPQCSAIPGAPKPVFDIYPAELQADPKFCEALQQHKDHGTLLAPFTVVRGTKEALTAVPITEAYKDRMTAISKELDRRRGCAEGDRRAAARRLPACGGDRVRHERLGPRRRGVGEDDRRQLELVRPRRRPTRSTGSRARARAACT